MRARRNGRKYTPFMKLRGVIGNEFAAVLKQLQSEPDEGGIQVAGFDANRTHDPPFHALASELAVRRVKNRRVKSRTIVDAKEPPVVEEAGRRKDEILLTQGSCEPDAGGVADSTAVLECAAEIRNEPVVELPNRRALRIRSC